MSSLHNALAPEVSRPASANARMFIIRPPALSLLPRRRTRPGSLAASVFLHAISMVALIWLPRLFAEPFIVAPEHLSKSESLVLDEPLVLPQLPRLEDQGFAPRPTKSLAQRSSAPSAAPEPSAPPRTPDYAAPQTIVSNVANPVNRIQTILRPDLVKPPNLKFPLRLQSLVILPSPAAPVLAPPAPVPIPEQAPAIKPTVETPVLTLTAKTGSVIRAKAASAQNVSPDLKNFSSTNSNAIKALVVVNAVQVVPDPSTAVPEGQLAGNFVVGPSNNGSGAGSSSPSSATVSGTGSVVDHSATPGDGNASGSGSEAVGPGKGGSGISTSPKPGNGSGGTGPANGSASSGSGTGAVSSGAPGISISGGVPGRNRAVTANSFPGRPSYSMMIISGGASGGASRDLGVFSRSETVYSVSIPMTDAGGGPDWTMQYALRDPAQTGSGLLVPPIAQKKVAATVKPSPISIDAGPVFVTAIVDENGKLQSLRPVRVQDTRWQTAVRALEQWEFLPAQLDGKPAACKILMGVAVKVQE